MVVASNDLFPQIVETTKELPVTDTTVPVSPRPSHVTEHFVWLPTTAISLSRQRAGGLAKVTLFPT
jgi:hypothetical protein